MRLIDADALKKSFDNADVCDGCKNKRTGCPVCCTEPHFLTDGVERVIDAQPTIDPARHGHLVECKDDNMMYECSECGNKTYKYWDDIGPDTPPKYCDTCGARLDGEIVEWEWVAVQKRVGTEHKSGGGE